MITDEQAGGNMKEEFGVQLTSILQHRIVAMVIYRDVLFVATDSQVFFKNDEDVLRPLKFECEENFNDNRRTG